VNRRAKQTQLYLQYPHCTNTLFSIICTLYLEHRSPHSRRHANGRPCWALMRRGQGSSVLCLLTVLGRQRADSTRQHRHDSGLCGCCACPEHSGIYRHRRRRHGAPGRLQALGHQTPIPPAPDLVAASRPRRIAHVQHERPPRRRRLSQQTQALRLYRLSPSRTLPRDAPLTLPSA
jgi:hypothetical protein